MDRWKGGWGPKRTDGKVKGAEWRKREEVSGILWCIGDVLVIYWWKRIKKYCQHHAVSGATTLKRLRPGGLAWDVIITALLSREKNHSQETKCGTKIYHLFIKKSHKTLHKNYTNTSWKSKHSSLLVMFVLSCFTPSLVGLLFCQLCQVRCCPS